MIFHTLIKLILLDLSTYHNPGGWPGDTKQSNVESVGAQVVDWLERMP